MNRPSLLVSTGFLVTALAARAVLAQEPSLVGPPTPGASNRTVLLGQPFLQVIRRYGQPSRLRSVELVPVAGGKAIPAVLWIYERNANVTLEFLIGGDGKVVQTTTRSKDLDQYRIELKP